MPCVFPILSLKALSLAQGQCTTSADPRGEALAYHRRGVVDGLPGAGRRDCWRLRAGGATRRLGVPAPGSARDHACCCCSSPGDGAQPRRLFEIRAPQLRQSGAARRGRGLLPPARSPPSSPRPCTGPFMGAALGAALVLPWPAALAVFRRARASASRSALPRCSASYRRCASALPKPGAWMETISGRILAIPMWLTAIALVWVLGRQTGRRRHDPSGPARRVRSPRSSLGGRAAGRPAGSASGRRRRDCPAPVDRRRRHLARRDGASSARPGFGAGAGAAEPFSESTARDAPRAGQAGLRLFHRRLVPDLQGQREGRDRDRDGTVGLRRAQGRGDGRRLDRRRSGARPASSRRTIAPAYRCISITRRAPPNRRCCRRFSLPACSQPWRALESPSEREERPFVRAQQNVAAWNLAVTGGFTVSMGTRRAFDEIMGQSGSTTPPTGTRRARRLAGRHARCRTAPPPAIGRARRSASSASPSRSMATATRRNASSRSTSCRASSSPTNGRACPKGWCSGSRRSTRSSTTSMASGRSSRPGVLPEDLIFGNPQFRPEIAGMQPPHGVLGAYLRHRSGAHRPRRILRAGGQCADTVGRQLHARKSRGDAAPLPELFRDFRVAAVDSYPDRLLETMKSVAPHGSGQNPVCVVLTPGHFNSAYYEHSFLADLDGHRTGRGGRSGGRRRHRVDAHYRRPGEGRRDLSPHRRRLSRSSGIPSGSRCSACPA